MMRLKDICHMYDDEDLMNESSSENFFDDGEAEFESFEDMDRQMLCQCGYSESSPRFAKIFESVVADTEFDKIFAIFDGEAASPDATRSYKIDGMVEEILKDEVFDRYWRENIYSRLDDEADAKLLEQWTPDFMPNEVRHYLAKMNRDEKFYYIEFFREILSKSDNDDAVNLINFGDKDFDKMPNVTRIH